MIINDAGIKEIQDIVSKLSDADLDVVNEGYSYIDKRIKQSHIFEAMKNMAGVDSCVVDMVSDFADQQIALEVFTDGFVQQLAKYEYATEIWLRMKNGEDAA
ncbi:hypothetical protein [Symbiopectobacterium purcellii]|uniref:Uncharacterized protein n=1 Tax=Symbiopectobacterium purcellii TaxID=2871826 RepID=A0ABX9AV00_9ENTR|nr:hypothetical protein [Symbiopectobacterium purcellii]QZN97821.1 hypothetical protein K6K13_11255 [Symbiopectobacterium purcellii]